MMESFANILLTGPCNLQCPDCIGQRLRRQLSPSTLDRFPLPGMELFTQRLRAEKVSQVSVSGIDTDPMLYRHTERLLSYLRAHVPHVRISVHSNGLRALSHTSTFHAYDRATLSLPSLDPATCFLMTGSSHVLDLRRIRSQSRIPIKLSILLTEHNQHQVPAMLRTVQALGYKRVVLRCRYGDKSTHELFPQQPSHFFGGNPVYPLDGLEVTVWDFCRTTLPCINLLPDGSVRDGYQLSEVLHAPLS